MNASSALRPRLRGLLLVSCGLAAACSGPPAPEPLQPPPELSLKVDHFAGTPLSGPLGRDALERVSTDPNQALGLRVDFLLVDTVGRLSASGGAEEVAAEPLVDALEAVVDPNAAQAVVATSRLGSGGLLVTGEAASRAYAALLQAGPVATRSIGEGNEVVLPGATTRVAAESGTASRLAVAIHGKDAMHADVTVELAAPGFGSELLKLAHALTAPEPMLIVVPSPFDRCTARGCALRLELTPAPKEGDVVASHAASVKRALEDAARASEAVVAVEPSGAGASTGLDALRQLAADAAARDCLVQLGVVAQAPLFTDFALVASDQATSSLLKQLLEARPALVAANPDAAAFAFALDREAWRFIVKLALDTDLEPGVTALLYRHAGAVASWPSTLDEIVAKSEDASAFGQRLIHENVLLLEDHSAAVRVRAYDWLAGRRAAPEGFDPLAPLPQRRAALAKLNAAEPNGG